jgi:hypothetical protein
VAYGVETVEPGESISPNDLVKNFLGRRKT